MTTLRNILYKLPEEIERIIYEFARDDENQNFKNELITKLKYPWIGINKEHSFYNKDYETEIYKRGYLKQYLKNNNQISHECCYKKNFKI
jgi:hypothetical protein